MKIDTLKKANEEIRNKIDKLIGINSPIYSPLWNNINDLIENEINQEEECTKNGR